MIHPHFSRFVALFLAIMTCHATLVLTPSQAHATPVEDFVNLVQNTTTAVSEVQSVVNQGTMLKNQLQSIKHQAQTLQQLDIDSLEELSSALNEVHQLLYKSQAVANRWEAMSTDFNRIYGDYAGDDYNPLSFSEKKRAWEKVSDQAIEESLEAQSKISKAKNTLSKSSKHLSTKNNTVEGVVEAIQITNKNLEVLANQQALLMEMILKDSHAKKAVQLEKRKKDQLTRAKKKEILGKDMSVTEEIPPVTLPNLH